MPALFIDAYDSSKGPWDANKAELGGSLGVNGTFRSNGGAFTFLTGNMWDASSINATGPTDVKQELHAVGPITTSAAFNVGQPNSSNPPPTVPVVPGTASADGYVNGNITASGAPMTFFKDLYVPSAGTTRTNVVVNGSLKTLDMAIPPPCDSCGGAQIPVGTIVDHFAAAANNDNAAIGLSPSAMSNLNGTTRLDLPCGYYYLDSINAQGSVTIYAHGHTALFIGGDVSADILSFTLDPTGSFDVFIKGTIRTQADLVIGNPNYAALTRTYVGAPGFSIAGEAHIAGLFYVANSDIDLQSHITLYGALYVNNFSGVGDNTDIHYDRAALKLDRECCAKNDQPDFEGTCPGSPPPQCNSCKDCANQACVNGACAHCTSSAQCCAPLVCQGGQCIDVVL